MGRAASAVRDAGEVKPMMTTDDGTVTKIQELLRRTPDLVRVDVDAITHVHGVPVEVVDLCLERERRRRRQEKITRVYTAVVPTTLAEYLFVSHLVGHGFTCGTSNEAYGRAYNVTPAYVRAVRQFARDGGSFTVLADNYERFE
jgi:hypothetical protein